MNLDDKQALPLPDKNIPASVMIIGSFEIAVSLLGLIILVLADNFDGGAAAFLILIVVYGTMGAGLLAIQEWARRTNVILHIVAVPYTFYTTFILDEPLGWQSIMRLLIALGIIWALTRPEIQYKFQTVVPKQKKH